MRHTGQQSLKHLYILIVGLKAIYFLILSGILRNLSLYKIILSFVLLEDFLQSVRVLSALGCCSQPKCLTLKTVKLGIGNHLSLPHDASCTTRNTHTASSRDVHLSRAMVAHEMSAVCLVYLKKQKSHTQKTQHTTVLSPN